MNNAQQQEKELHEKFIRGVTWKTAGVVIAGVISIVTTFIAGYNGIQDSMKDTRTEFRESIQQLKSDFRTQIDSIKYNQVKSHYENEIRFNDLENKIDKNKK